MNLEPTASLGKLVIDEKHGYIGICKREKYKEKDCIWIPITDIDEIALYCVKPRADYSRNVKCDCEFSCHIISENKTIKRVVKTNIGCKHHKSKTYANREEWEEPGIISMMRSIINQTYISAVQDELKQWRNQLVFVRETVFEQARCALMLPFPFTSEQLEENYHKLISVFDSFEQNRLINQYYQVLKGTL